MDGERGSHGGTKPRRKSVVATAVSWRLSGLRIEKMVGSDRRADPKFRRAAPSDRKKDSHRGADGGERKVAEF